MNKGKKIGLIILIAGVIVALLGAGVIIKGGIAFRTGTTPTLGAEVRVFADLAECENIEAKKTDGAMVTVYDTSDKDKYRKGLDYNRFYGCHYDSDEMKFELFAYEFSTDQAAQEYFKNATGKTDEQTTNFSSSKGMTRFCRVVIHEKNAYVIECQNEYLDETTGYLSECFSLTLEQAKSKTAE